MRMQILTSSSQLTSSKTRRQKKSEPAFSLPIILLSWLFVLFSFHNAQSQSNFNIDGEIHIVQYNTGGYQDFIVPDDPSVSAIKFALYGADGGAAEVHAYVPAPTLENPLRTVYKSEKARGGQGAKTEFTIDVGSGGLSPGTTIRFIVGEKGESGSSEVTYIFPATGNGFDYGGGGGGTGLIFQKPSETEWFYLGVAGGGGGAYQGMTFFVPSNKNNGQGGRSGENGGDGSGLGAPKGGSATLGGGGNVGFGGGGGGSVQKGGGVLCTDLSSTTYVGGGFPGKFTGGAGGNWEGCYSFTWRNGGKGYGAGGAGAGVGGGGGGYSGGGAGGGVTGSGGGGGSFIGILGYDKDFRAGGNVSNLDNGSIVYQIIKNESPVAICKNTIIHLNANGSATLSAGAIDKGSSDREDGANVTLSLSKSSFDCSNVGPNTVTLTVKDKNGSESSCTSTVTVVDNTNPVARFANEITVKLGSDGKATFKANQLDNGSTDNCLLDPETSFSASQTTFDCDDVGTPVTVTLTVTDPSDNEDHSSAIVTVVDDINPVAVSHEKLTVQLDENGMAAITPEQINSGSTDNCSITTMTLDIDEFDCSDVGTPVTVTLTVTDPSGNQDKSTTIVTVVDDIKPVAVSHEKITVQLDGNGMAAITPEQINNESTDNCSITTMTLDIYEFDCDNVGDVTVTLTVTDPSGHEDKSTTIVTVVDEINPVAVSHENITVELDAAGKATITPELINNGSTDNCSIATMALDIYEFACDNVGDVTVTLTVTDPSGHEDKSTSTVTVLDEIKPVAVCHQNITIQLDANGMAFITPDQLDNGSTDNCGLDPFTPFSASQTTFDFNDVGDVLVTLTVTDENGNTSTCTSTVTVEDNIKPNVRTRDVTVILDKYGEASVDVDRINNGTTDNSIIARMWLEGLTEYDCGDIGEHEVVLKAEDQSGNVGSHNAFVTVKFYKPDFESMLGLANGDTLHQVNCQVPREIAVSDEDRAIIKQYGTITSHIYKVDTPENAPWSQYAVWQHELVMKDACAHTYRFTFYQALYDLDPPVFQYFPYDTTVASIADVPEIDEGVKILDVCQYAVWDTVMTTPVLDQVSGDTLGYTRRWMARDPSGHESFRDQMIWIGSGFRDQYSVITGRLAGEDDIRTARWAGEAGTNDIPVSLYRLDTSAGTRIWVDSWTTGDFMSAQGTYYFAPKQPGSYQVRIDSTICLVDTLKFDKELWSDTLELLAGESLDQGWVITKACIGVEVINPLAKENGPIVQAKLVGMLPEAELTKTGAAEWTLYPNPTRGYLRIDIRSDKRYDFRLYDALGRSVKSGVYQRGQTIELSGLNSGLYYLQLKDKEEVLGTRKVLFMK